MPLFAPTLPSLDGRTHTTALTDTGDTAIGHAVADRLAEQAAPGQSGVHLLRDGRDAFAARALLARGAERSLDVQYYIWHGDLSGTLMLHELRAAAHRGVRVRLLLDDNGIGGLDEALAALDAHPQVEVRLFNPFVIRAPKSLNWLLDFRRLNRRMHAKSFTADGAATVVGGRNVGDEYFGAREDGLFVDLDALCLGPVVADVAGEFDAHWNSPNTYPADRLLPAITPARRAAVEAEEARVRRSRAADEYDAAVEALPLFDEMTDGQVDFTWATLTLVSDDPARVLGREPPGHQVADRVDRFLASAVRELTLVSGYFVPTDDALAQLERQARAGVSVRALTNSYAATDVGAVHAGYAPHRHRLLAAGVELFEMPAPDDKPKVKKFVRPGGRGGQMPGTTLHAKVFVVDRERLFVGSFNLDPRSARLNTELGVLIDSPPNWRGAWLAPPRWRAASTRRSCRPGTSYRAGSVAADPVVAVGVGVADRPSWRVCSYGPRADSWRSTQWSATSGTTSRRWSGRSRGRPRVWSRAFVRTGWFAGAHYVVDRSERKLILRDAYSSEAIATYELMAEPRQYRGERQEEGRTNGGFYVHHYETVHISRENGSIVSSSLSTTTFPNGQSTTEIRFEGKCVSENPDRLDTLEF